MDFMWLGECSKYYSDINKWSVKGLQERLDAGRKGKERAKGMESGEVRIERWGWIC